MHSLEYLNISTVENTPERCVITMPIRDEVKQPFGIVHGGINAFLAETAASLGANSTLDTTNYIAVGVDVHTHHLKAATHGTLETIATPVKLGRTLQTWQVTTVETHSATETAFSTVTLMIQPRPKEA